MVKILGSLALLMFTGGVMSEDSDTVLLDLREAIHALVGDANCLNIVNCRLLTLGSSPCASDVEFLAYSVGVTRNQIELDNLVMEYNLLSDDNSADGHAISCEAPEKTLVNCISGRCVIVRENN